MTTSAYWLRHLPSSIRARFENRPNLVRILVNTGWLIFDKIFRMGMGLIVGVWVARYLGPQQFGLFNYATAVVALFSAVSTLGLNNIVVRDLVKMPQDASTTLGTAFLLQIIGGCVAFCVALLAVTVMRPGDGLATMVVGILGLSMIFKSTEVIKYWFEARVNSKYAVLVENGAFLTFSVVKVALILNGAKIQAFAWIVLAESVMVAALLLFVYRGDKQSLKSWRFQYERAKTLMQDSWPLILAGLAAMIYMRIDQIMLGQMLDDRAVGIYSAAVRLSEVWYFIPMTIAASVFPAIIKARQSDHVVYQKYLTKLFRLMVLLALAVAIPISFTADRLMDFLYGAGYSDSAYVLIIHVWTGLFVFMGVASSRWFIAENLQKHTFYRTLAGCVVNVCLNLALIPRYGPIGSAWSSVISQAVGSFLFNALNRKTRPIFFMQANALLMPISWAFNLKRYRR